MNKKYLSVLAPYMESLVEMKRIQGMRTDRYETVLKQFDAYCIENEFNDLNCLTQDNLNRWREEMINVKANTVYAKYCIISQLIRHINDLGIPVKQIRLPKNGTDVYVPYIFSREQINQIFTQADLMSKSANDVHGVLFVIPTALRILYGSGIRSGELVNIRNEDVNFNSGTLTLCHTKNGQDRLVPLSRSALAVMLQYRIERQKLGIDRTEEPTSYFFVSAKGNKLNEKHGLYMWFRRVLKKCGIHHMGRKYGPRVHDLRHTFAVHSMMKQVENGVDLQVALPWLSTYLGHKSIYATEKYVRLASDALRSVVAMQNDLATDIFPQLKDKTNEYYW